MDEILCPLCGKPNPSDADTCQFCQAPLKTSAFAPPSGDENVPEWLSTLQGGPGEAESQGVQPEAAPAPEQPIPDWLQAAGTPAQETPASGAEEPIPDWLSGQAELPAERQPSPPIGAGEPAAEQPDWLESLLAETRGSGVPQPAFPEGEENLPSVPVEPGEPGAFTEPISEEPQVSPGDQSEIPDWLADLKATSSAKSTGGTPAFIFDKEEAEKSGAGEEPGAGLAPAELPGWLEAIRPVEAVSPTAPIEDVSGADIVTAGPLVGLRGVISAEPEAVRARKPAAYSIKLHVTDEQRDRVALLEELLAAEQRPKPLPTQPVITSQYIFRLVIAAVLLLPIVWLIITGSHQTPLPQQGSAPGVGDFVQQVQALPSGAPVLLAFDYEAGFSGEMNIAAFSVVRELIIKDSFLTIVTTSTSGPALAESFIKNLITELEGNQGVYSNYANLGYIPGGTIGLIGMANSPKSVLPYTLEGIDVWAVAPLNTISTLADFRAVVVLTNDSDTARIWIEQVGPVLQTKGTPLLMVTSSQAEPLVRPYFEGSPRQIQGLVAGIVGGIAYGSGVGSSLVNGIWDAYSAGILVSVLIILIGSVVSAISKVLAFGKKKE